MKNLRNAFVLSFLCLHSINVECQNTSTLVKEIQYSIKEKLHSRGLASDKKNIFIAASDGKLYILNLKNLTVQDRDYGLSVELRDVELSKKTIVLLGSGDSSATISINRKTDKYVINKFQGLFLDGISIERKTLFMMGDPKSNSFMLFKSENAGETWTHTDSLPEAIKGEAGFAASGTNVQMTSKNDFYFVSGGMDSRLYQTHDAGKTWADSNMGFPPCNSCGAYSFLIMPDKKTIIVVGGDYTQPNKKIGNCRISNDGGLNWHSPKLDLNGYRSNLIYHKKRLFACGTNGIDVSTDFGETWQSFALGNYFTMTVFRNELVASTTNGSIQFFNLKKLEK